MRNIAKTKLGFTLIEVLITIAILGFISIFTYNTYEKSVDNARIDAVESDLRAYSQSFSSYFLDYSNIQIDSGLTESTYKDKAEEIIEILNLRYLPAEIKLESVAADKKSFICKTVYKKDPWNNNYTIYVNTYTDTGLPAGTVIVASNGRDSQSNSNEYKNGNHGDDILAIIEPRSSN